MIPTPNYEGFLEIPFDIILNPYHELDNDLEVYFWMNRNGESLNLFLDSFGKNFLCIFNKKPHAFLSKEKSGVTNEMVLCKSKIIKILVRVFGIKYLHGLVLIEFKKHRESEVKVIPIDRSQFMIFPGMN